MTALLAVLLSLERLFLADFEDGSLELLALARGGRPGAPLDTGGRAALPDPVTAEAARLLPADWTYVVMSPGAGGAGSRGAAMFRKLGFMMSRRIVLQVLFFVSGAAAQCVHRRVRIGPLYCGMVAVPRVDNITQVRDVNDVFDVLVRVDDPIRLPVENPGSSLRIVLGVR